MSDLDLQDGWQQELPEDMRGSGVLENITSVETLAKMAIDGRNLANTSLRIPSKEASVEDRNAFNTDLMAKIPNMIAKPGEGEDWGSTWNAMGRPEEASGYKLGEIPEPIKANLESLSTKAHELGLSQAQMQGIAGTIVEDFSTNMNAAKGRNEESINALKTEWGSAFDAKVKNLQHFTENTGFSEGFTEALGNGSIAKTDMMALDTVLHGFEGEGVNIGKQPGDSSATITPDEAKAQINELWANKDSGLRDASHPNHDAAVKKNLELHKLAEAGKIDSDVDTFRKALAGG